MRTDVDGLRRRPARDEHGMQTVEWIGIGAVAAALTGGILIPIDPIGLQVRAAILELIDRVLSAF